MALFISPIALAGLFFANPRSAGCLFVTMTPTTEPTIHRKSDDNHSAQLQEERRLREELCSTVSHDMRSPVGAINIFCEILLSQSEQLNDQQLQSVRMIAEAASKLQRIIEDTVVIARIHGESAPLRWNTVDARSAVQSAIAHIHPVAQSAGIRITEIFKATNPVLFIDDERLEQMIVRMIVDAVRSSAEPTEIEVSDMNRDGSYVLSVRASVDATRGGRVLSEAARGVFNKGRLGLRTPGESRFAWQTCEQLARTFGGSLNRSITSEYSATLELPVSAEAAFMASK